LHFIQFSRPRPIKNRLQIITKSPPINIALSIKPKLKLNRKEFSMTEQTLIQEIHALPESLKLEVLHFIQFLKQKQNIESEPAKPRQRKAGSAKGKFVMADDFDAPLEDFAEYM